MNSIKLYIELIGKALNGNISPSEASALKQLDTLIETEDKLDEGVLDLEQYSWAFSPSIEAMINEAESNPLELAENLANFTPTEKPNMSTPINDPLQAISGVKNKAAIMDAMTLDNPVEQAIIFQANAGFVPKNIQDKVNEALAPLEETYSYLDQIEENVRNAPSQSPYQFSDEEWEEFRNRTPNGVQVGAQWLASIGMPVLGGAFGGPGGAVAGAVAAPEFPIIETIELFPEDTQDVIYAGMSPWMLSILAFMQPEKFKKVEAKQLTKIKGGVLLEPTVEEFTNANTKEKGLELGKKGKRSKMFNDFFKNGGYKKWLPSSTKGRIGLVVAGGLLLGSIFGDDDVEPTVEPVSEEVLPEEPTTVDTIAETQDDTGGFQGSIGDTAQEEIDKWMAKNVPNLDDVDYGQSVWTVPDEMDVSYDLGLWNTDTSNTYIGPSMSDDDLNYIQPTLPKGGKINPNALKKYNFGALGEIPLLSYIQIAAKANNIPFNLLYGQIAKETFNTFDPTSFNGKGENSYGLAQINMDVWGEGNENPASHIPGGHAFITPEMAMDPKFAVDFLVHNVKRLTNHYSDTWDPIVGIIGHRGGPSHAEYYARTGKYKTDMDKSYIDDIFGYANQSKISGGEGFDSFEFMNKWNNAKNTGVGASATFTPTEPEAVNLFIDKFIEGNLGRKATKADYDTWAPQFTETEKKIFNASLEGDYKGLTLGQTLQEGMEDTGEFKFVDNRKNYQTVQDWMTKNVLGVFDI